MAMRLRIRLSYNTPKYIVDKMENKLFGKLEPLIPKKLILDIECYGFQIWLISPFFNILYHFK